MIVFAIVYLLCAATALACSILLFSKYRRIGVPLLLWSSLCFAGLTLDNLLLFVDRIVLPSIDYTLYRLPLALLSVALLLYGMIWKGKL